MKMGHLLMLLPLFLLGCGGSGGGGDSDGSGSPALSYPPVVGKENATQEETNNEVKSDNDSLSVTNNEAEAGSSSGRDKNNGETGVIYGQPSSGISTGNLSVTDENLYTEQPNSDNTTVNEPSFIAPMPLTPSMGNMADTDSEYPLTWNGYVLTRDTANDSSVLSRYAFTGANDHYNIITDSKSAVFEKDAPETVHIVTQELATVKSADGDLLGYYGYVLEWADKEFLGIIDKYPRSDYFVAADIREIRKPDVDAQYSGKVFYDYEGAGGKEANIDLVYNNRDSMITGSIHNNANDFMYMINATQEKNNVYEDGHFIAGLSRTEDIHNNRVGKIEGAFYGENSEVALGTINSEEEDNSWGGVFGVSRVN